MTLLGDNILFPGNYTVISFLQLSTMPENESSLNYVLVQNLLSALFFIKVGQLTMALMFQDQLLNPVQKVSTIQNALQEWL